jgi:hypothetical protein
MTRPPKFHSETGENPGKTQTEDDTSVELFSVSTPPPAGQGNPPFLISSGAPANPGSTLIKNN